MENLENALMNKSETESFSFISSPPPPVNELLSSPSLIEMKETSMKHQQEPYVVDTLKIINNVRKEGDELEERVRYYKGSSSAGDRVFKQFNEKIIRLLISLDRIDVKDYNILKQAKKDAIESLKEIQAVLKTR